MTIIDFCQNISFEISLLEVIISLLILIIVSEIVFIIKKLLIALNKQRQIDKRLKETRDRISKVVTEIKSYQARPTVVEIIGEEVSGNQEVSEVAHKAKKTRAMSMEERWAEYDKKRAKIAAKGKNC